MLFIDDFLAFGNAGLGVIDLCRQAGAEIVGMGFIIEKEFQGGRKVLEEAGVKHIESLATIESLENNQIKLKGVKIRKVNIYEEASRCLLCQDAPCTKACKTGDPARAIRAIRFDNHKPALRWVENCSDGDLERAEQACIHYNWPIRIKDVLRSIHKDDVDDTQYPELAIEFCGIKCENPFFLASSAVCTNYEMVAHAFEAGWAGVFYKTICLQEINEVSPRFDAMHNNATHGDFYGFRNMEQLSENLVEEDFDILHRLKKNYPTKVVVASIMGQTEEQWMTLARMAEEAGCDAVELNFSCPQMKHAGMGSDVGQSPELVKQFTACVKRSVKIPVISKMTPNITHITEPAVACIEAGSDAISAINTIKSVTMDNRSEINGRNTISGYSGRAVRPIALRYVLELAQMPTRTELSGIGGIETWRDALEFIQLGCNNVQVCTAVMQYGYRIIDDLILGLRRYMAKRGVSHLNELVGEQVPRFSKPNLLDRGTIIYPKFNKDLCVGCGRCETSCSDGGHQAIVFDRDTRQPRLNGAKCVGCHLCRLLWAVIVTQHEVLTLCQQFAAHYLTLHGWQRQPGAARYVVARTGEGYDRRHLGHAVALKHLKAQGLQTLAYLTVKGGTATHAVVQVTTHLLVYRTEYDARQAAALCLLTHIKQGARHGRRLYLLHDTGVERLPQARHTHHDCYLATLQGVHDVRT